MGIIWAMGFQYLQKVISDQKLKFPFFNIYYFFLFACAWIGAKLLFLVTQDQYGTNELIGKSHFWLGGGLVFYGGLIGGGLITLVYKLLYKIPFQSLSYFVLPLSLGHSLGRVACFLAGCCYGKVCDLPWAIIHLGEDRHPVALYEALCIFVLHLYLKRSYRKKLNLIIRYVLGYAVIRFLLEFFRGDRVRGYYFEMLSTSQIISLILFGAACTWIIIKKITLKKSNV